MTQQPIPPDHVLSEKDRVRYQALADKTGEVVMVTDARPSIFYPHQSQRATDKEAGN